jgi:hypothetical protein
MAEALPTAAADAPRLDVRAVSKAFGRRTVLAGELALEHTLGSAPGPGRGGATRHPDLFPENNPVLQPPVRGRVGLWSKTDSTSAFKDYAVDAR